MLKWARVHGYPWDEETCRSAIHGGHLEVLKWALGEGCPWVVVNAATIDVDFETGGNEEMLSWMLEEGLIYDSDPENQHDENADDGFDDEF